jgi:tetratricopeptide (TPR) repeat protein
MKSSAVWGLVCLAAVVQVCAIARADADYYQALDGAEHAAKSGDYPRAAQTVAHALINYPNDYRLTLELAWYQLLNGDYRSSELNYLRAIALSDGALEARLGLGWVFVHSDRCQRALSVLQTILDESPDETAARNGLIACAEQKAVHGSVWLGLAGSEYTDHPWKRSSVDGLLGLKLRYRSLAFGAAYRFLSLAATDHRVAGYAQHEAYLQAGYARAALEVLAHAAYVWGGDALGTGSAHAGVTARLPIADVLREMNGQLTLSRYPDLWIVRVAVSTVFSLSRIQLVPEVAVEQVGHEALTSGALTASLTLGRLTLWASGKIGEEYRAAFLSQFAIFNSEDRSLWSVAGGARLGLSEHWALFGSYVHLRTRTRDEIASSTDIVGMGPLYLF